MRGCPTANNRTDLEPVVLPDTEADAIYLGFRLALDYSGCTEYPPNDTSDSTRELMHTCTPLCRVIPHDSRDSTAHDE